MKYKLDLTSLKNAYESLSEILIRYSKESDDSAIRDATIQRFEYTYSLSLKMLRRYLEVSLDEPLNIDSLDFNNIIRTSNEMGLLLSDLEKWSEYRKARNLTSHTYDENVAKQVVSVIPNFKADVEFLLEQLKERN